MFRKFKFAPACLALVLAPAALAAPAPAPTPVRHDAVRYAHVDGQDLLLDVVEPSTNPKGIILCIHGGGWVGGARSECNAALTAFSSAGYIVAAADYRLAPAARYPAPVLDLKAAVRWLRSHFRARFAGDPPIAAMGMSAGGELAQFLGMTNAVNQFEGDEGVTGVSSEVSAVVSYYGVSDLPRAYDDSIIAGQVVPIYLGGGRDEQRERHILASPIVWASRLAPPTLCVHGDADPYVNIRQSRSMVARLQELGVDAELKVVAGGGHEFKGADWDRVAAWTLAFLDRTFGTPNRQL